MSTLDSITSNSELQNIPQSGLLFSADGRECSTCNVFISWEQFSRNKQGFRGKLARCKGCESVRLHKYYDHNPDKVLDNVNKWQRNNIDKVRGIKNRWDGRNKENRSERKRKRRARMLKVRSEPTLSKEFLLKCQGGMCANCKRKENKISSVKGKGKWAIDHIVPLSRGGANANDNIEVLCWECNGSKHAKMPEDWELENGRLPFNFGSV